MLAAVALVALAATTRHLRLGAVAAHQSGQRHEDTYYLPRADWLPLLSLGYRQALATLIWCKSLIYFGEELAHRGQVEYVFEYTDAILALDPDFRPAYRWIATAAVYRPREVSIEDGLRASRYLEHALQRWPADGELHWDYGSLLRFELAPLETDPARKQVLLERATPSIAMAAKLGAGPPWLALNSSELLARLGRTEQAIRHIEEVLPTIRDPAVERSLTARLEALRTESYRQAADVALEQLERTRLRHYPYLSEALFLLVHDGSDYGTYADWVAAAFPGEAWEPTR